VTRRTKRLVALSAVILLVGGLSAVFLVVVLPLIRGHRTLPIYPCGARATRTPAAAVRGYYTALSKHRFVVAAQYIAPTKCRYFQTGTDNDFEYVDKVTDVSVSEGEILNRNSLPVELPRDLTSHNKWADVRVDFNATYLPAAETFTNGRQVRFLLVGRSIKSGRWEIVDEGTGP